MKVQKPGANTMRSSTAQRAAVPKEALAYRDASAKPGGVVIPLRSYSPPPPKPDVPARMPNVPNSDLDLMHLALVKAFAIERRDTTRKDAPAGAGGCWPFPTVAEATDYGEAEMVKGGDGVERLRHKPPPVKPPPPNAMEIKFRDDVELLLLKLAVEDRWGSKLVAARAARVGWDALIKRDPFQRKRMQQHRLRLKALERMVTLDAELNLNVGRRVETI